MGFYHLLSMSEDWGSFSDPEAYIAHTFEHLFPADRPTKPMFAANIRKWAATYTPFYTEFRRRIAEIARRNWERVGLETRYRDPAQFTRDDIVVFSDDDDWYHPDVGAEVLAAFDGRPDIDLVYWDSWQYKTCYLKEGFERFTGSLIGSNALALRGGLPNSHYWGGAHVLVERTIPPERRLYIPKMLSIWNIHSACLHINELYPLNDQMDRLERTPRPPDFDWAAGEIEAMYAVASSVRRL